MARAAGVTLGTPSTVFTRCSMTLFGRQQLWWAEPTTVWVRVPGGGLSRAGDVGPATIRTLPLSRSRGDMS